MSVSTGSAITAQASSPVAQGARAPKVAIAAASADSGPGAASAARRTASISLLGDAFDQRADQFDLAGKIAIDGAGRDARARRDRRDLDRRHAARRRGVPRRIDDGVVAGVEPADHIFGAAIGHAPKD